MMLIALSVAALAGEVWEGDEESALANASLAIVGEVIDSQCLSSAIVDDFGTLEERFEATIEINEVISSKIGEITAPTITVVSPIRQYSDGLQPDCDTPYLIHPVGQSGTYYVQEIGSETEPSYRLYLGQAFVESDSSNPQAAPECPSLDVPAAEEELESGGAANEKLSCSTMTGSPAGGVLSLLAVLCGLIRRRR